MSEYIRLQANGADAYPDASTENTYRPNGTSVESALVNLESNVTTLGGVAGDAKTLAEQNSVKIATAEQEISNINSSLNLLDKRTCNIINDTSKSALDQMKEYFDTMPLNSMSYFASYNNGRTCMWLVMKNVSHNTGVAFQIFFDSSDKPVMYHRYGEWGNAVQL